MSSKRRKKKNNEMINTENAAAESSIETADAEAESAEELTEEPEIAADNADDAAEDPENAENDADGTAEAAADDAEDTDETGDAADAEETAAPESSGKPAVSDAAKQVDPPVVRVTPKPARLHGRIRRGEPVRTVTPADIRKPQVSFLNSIANIEAETAAQRDSHISSTAQAYDHAVIIEEDPEITSYSPKIRRMQDSTSARERRRRAGSGENLQYERVTPVAAPQTMPASKLRKKRGGAVSPEVLERIPEKLKRHPQDSRPVRYLGKSQHTQINLSDSAEARRNIDIDVRYLNEHRERTDLPKQVRPVGPDNKKSIRNDLLELNSNLALRIFILGFLTICSGLITLLDWIPSFPMPSFLSSREAPLAFLTIQILLGFAALPFSASLLKNGYSKLVRFRADCDSLAAMSMISALLAAILILPSPGMLKTGIVSVYVAVGLLSLTVNAVGKKLIAVRAIRNFDRLTDGNPKYGIRYVEDEKRAENLTRGTTGEFPILAAMQRVEQPEDFLKYTFSTDLADKFCRTAVPVIFFISLLFSVGMALLRSGQFDSAVCYGTSIFALCFSACACTAITLISNLPLESGTRDYVRNSGLLLGYQSVDDFYDVNMLMVDAPTLFPTGTTQLESIQVIGESHLEETLQYAASLTHQAGSILKDTFSAAIVSDEKLILPVENYMYDEGKGISGWIDNKRVLLGTRDMMIEHSIEGIPTTAKVAEMTRDGSEALYFSISGSVSALFIVRIEAGKAVVHWLQEMEKENLFLLVRSNDVLLSQRRIAKMFGIKETSLKMIPARLEADYAAETQPVEKGRPSMLCAGRLAGFIQTIIGAKRIRSAATLGMILQAVTACLGLVYVILFIALGAYSDVRGGLLLVYHLICILVTVLAIRMKDT